MNRQRQDDTLDSELQNLSQTYREAIAGYDDEPPSSLDSTILAAAHREASSKPVALKKPRATRWQFPLATAAVVVISSTVALIGIREHPALDIPPVTPQASTTQQHPDKVIPAADMPPQLAQSEPAPAAMPKPASAPAEVAAQRTAPVKKRETAIPAMKADARTTADAPMLPAPQTPASLGESVEVEVKTEAEKEIRPLKESARSQVSGMNKAQAQSAREASAFPAEGKALPATGFSKRQAEVSQENAMAPDIWLERIERLYKQGLIDEARADLEKFRRVYPQYKIPEALRTLVKQ